MDTYECTNDDEDNIDFSTALFKYFNTAQIPVAAFPYLDSLNVRFFTQIAMQR
jgi:hypothetical protein